MNLKYTFSVAASSPRVVGPTPAGPLSGGYECSPSAPVSSQKTWQETLETAG